MLIVHAYSTWTIHFKLNLPQICTSNRCENMGTEIKLMYKVTYILTAFLVPLHVGMY